MPTRKSRDRFKWVEDRATGKGQWVHRNPAEKKHAEAVFTEFWNVVAPSQPSPPPQEPPSVPKAKGSIMPSEPSLDYVPAKRCILARAVPDIPNPQSGIVPGIRVLDGILTSLARAYAPRVEGTARYERLTRAPHVFRIEVTVAPFLVEVKYGSHDGMPFTSDPGGNITVILKDCSSHHYLSINQDHLADHIAKAEHDAIDPCLPATHNSGPFAWASYSIHYIISDQGPPLEFYIVFPHSTTAPDPGIRVVYPSSRFDRKHTNPGRSSVYHPKTMQECMEHEQILQEALRENQQRLNEFLSAYAKKGTKQP